MNTYAFQNPIIQEEARALASLIEPTLPMTIDSVKGAVYQACLDMADFVHRYENPVEISEPGTDSELEMDNRTNE